ncbi:MULTISPECIES: DUF1707 SHOCT-like domain-containing protein [Nocardiopsidaceae]|uniref:DUF1707 domain-containing protein n=1 Tax=Streptomonospora nanhaiensis TaxID=1323731 RepID=A0ABY6YKD0_9ACTN|nr:DUF1707 domain-containing protein [Streptomonospora nanhaiensis]WAE72790.1 DUF1707 domain-containing protein [Streptomonospora nanhaiensis]
MAGTDPDRYRLSDRERDEALERLRTALEEGRLDPEEHGTRAGAVLEAVANTDLVPLFEDLPPESRPSALAVPGDAEPGDGRPPTPAGTAGRPPARREGGKGSSDRRNRPHTGGLVIWGGIMFVLWGVPSISSGNTGAVFAWLFFLLVLLVPGAVVATVQTVRSRSDGGSRALDQPDTRKRLRPTLRMNRRWGGAVEAVTRRGCSRGAC